MIHCNLLPFCMLKNIPKLKACEVDYEKLGKGAYNLWKIQIKFVNPAKCGQILFE